MSHPTAAAFRAAVEASDIDAASECLAEDVTFNSPVVFKPYEGRATVTALLRVVARTFEDFRYVNEIGPDGGHVLVFEARVGDKKLTGIDMFGFDEDGKIADFTVMLRPLSGTIAMAEAMAANLSASS